MTTKSGSRGQIIIEETASLLNGMPIITPQAALAKGELVEVFSDLRWDEDSQTYRLLLTCYPPGQWDVDWDGLPVFLTPTGDTSLPSFIARLNSRGQAFIHDIPEGQYRFSASTRWFYSKDPIIQPGRREVVGAERHAAAKEDGEISWPELPPTFSSNDSRVRVTTEQDEKGEILLSFETEDEELAGASVRFAMVRPDGQIMFSDRVSLVMADERAIWAGQWQGSLDISEPCHLMFEVFDKDNTQD